MYSTSWPCYGRVNSLHRWLAYGSKQAKSVRSSLCANRATVRKRYRHAHGWHRAGSYSSHFDRLAWAWYRARNRRFAQGPYLWNLRTRVFRQNNADAASDRWSSKARRYGSVHRCRTRARPYLRAKSGCAGRWPNSLSARYRRASARSDRNAGSFWCSRYPSRRLSGGTHT
jgi:hypothetical protein